MHTYIYIYMCIWWGWIIVVTLQFLWDHAVLFVSKVAFIRAWIDRAVIPGMGNELARQLENTESLCGGSSVHLEI